MSILDAYHELTKVEPRFTALLEEYGPVAPFVWHDGGRTGESNFAAMVLHITGQQISMRVAFAVFDRIAALTGGVPEPAGIAALTLDQLRGVALSGAKARYIQSLALAHLSHTIDLEHMDDLSDSETILQLTTQPGIGLWTAEMFLIHQLHRPDVLPSGDIGIRRGIQKLWGLETAPSIPETMARGMAWSPHRSYAAALLWRSLTPVDQISDQKERELAREAAVANERTLS